MGEDLIFHNATVDGKEALFGDGTMQKLKGLSVFYFPSADLSFQFLEVTRHAEIRWNLDQGT